LVDVPRHDPDLALARLDDAGAVGADEARLAARLEEGLLHADHVLLRHALGDGHDQRYLRLDRVEDRGRAEGGGHVDDARVRLDGGHGVGDRVEHGQVEVGLPALPGGDAPDHVGPVLDGLGRVEGPLLAREALADDAGGRVDPHLGPGAHGPGARRGRRGGGADGRSGSGEVPPNGG
ncbi:hypothetical protein THAOC_17492, partial [Thalassiosira oceanica]